MAIELAAGAAAPWWATGGVVVAAVYDDEPPSKDDGAPSIRLYREKVVSFDQRVDRVGVEGGVNGVRRQVCCRDCDQMHGEVNGAQPHAGYSAVQAVVQGKEMNDSVDCLKISGFNAARA